MNNELLRSSIHQRYTNLLSQAEVQRIVQERIIVGPQIKTNRKRRRRTDSGTSNVQGQFADRDWHPVYTEITQTQDS